MIALLRYHAAIGLRSHRWIFPVMLFNPPLLRHPGVAILATVAAAIVAVASGVSPAGAALRHPAATPATAQWPGLLPAIAAASLLALAWTASALAAARRG